jgi:NADH-quinone oxidoreductase subunit K
MFAIGVLGVLLRRNAVVIFMSVELMLNAVNLVFIAFSKSMGIIGGEVIVFFVMAIAAKGYYRAEGLWRPKTSLPGK